MGVCTGHRPGQETTLALLEGIAGGEVGRRLRAQLARWNAGASPEQVEDAFQEACARAGVSCLGQSEDAPSRYLRSKTEGEAVLQWPGATDSRRNDFLEEHPVHQVLGLRGPHAA